MPVLHETTFEDFVATRSPRLLHLAYLLTRDRGQAEDLLQTALARAWPMWDRIGEPEAYVRRIMVTTYSAWWRRKWNGEVPTERLPERHSGDPHGDLVERQRMLDALRRLPRRQRAVLVLRYYEDMSEVDIAAALGISPGTVKSHAAKALAALRLDPALAESTLRPSGPLSPVTLSAVQRQIILSRRRRVTAVAAACAVVVLLLLGYALSPHRRTAPPAHPSPTPHSLAPFGEFDQGTQVLDVQELTPGQTITFHWTATGRDAAVRFRCGVPAGLLLRFQLQLNGGPTWEDGLCAGLVTDYAAAISAERQSDVGLRPGRPATLTVRLSNTAIDGNVRDPDKRSTPVPKDVHVWAGFAISVPWEQYSFPPPQPLKSLNPVLDQMWGAPFAASGDDPMWARSATYVWKDTHLVMVRVGAPIQLTVLVGDRLYATCTAWDNREMACGFDLGPQSREAHGFTPAVGSTVTVTFVPVHATSPWAVYLATTVGPMK